MKLTEVVPYNSLYECDRKTCVRTRYVIRVREYFQTAIVGIGDSPPLMIILIVGSRNLLLGRCQL
jgi:hypothetical protein